MAGTNIGNYYLSVSPSFKGFASSVNSELGGIGSAQGEASGTSFKTGFLKKTVGIGAALFAASGLSGFVSEAIEASDATDKLRARSISLALIRVRSIPSPNQRSRMPTKPCIRSLTFRESQPNWHPTRSRIMTSWPKPQATLIRLQAAVRTRSNQLAWC